MSESTTERRPVGGLLLEPLAVRDFDLVSECFEPVAMMRALLPRGLVELTGARRSWRFRQHPTPRGDDAWHVIEQQAYLQVGERIHAVHLLCSGFRADTRPPSKAHHTTERVQQ